MDLFVNKTTTMNYQINDQEPEKHKNEPEKENPEKNNPLPVRPLSDPDNPERPVLPTTPGIPSIPSEEPGKTEPAIVPKISD